jgi:hypothetical protein
VTTADRANLAIGLLVLVYILIRQLQARPATADIRLPLILAVVGLVQLAQFLHRGSHGTEIIAVLIGSFVIAAAFAGVRAATVHVWVDHKGHAWRQGNWFTAVLWVVSLAIHLGYDYLVDGRGANAGLGAATLLLYCAITYTIQRLIVQARARNIATGQQRDPGTHLTVRWP